jgi:hypothetical protein
MKIVYDSYVPESALDAWSVQMQFLPSETIRGGTANGVDKVYKGTAVRKLFQV